MEEVWSSQIVIPPSLPSILKKYAKAAIRTQPYDLLVWSAAYFRAMAAGYPPPIKPRLELIVPDGKLLTIGYLKLLVSQFGREGEVSKDDLTEKWSDVSLPGETLESVLTLGNFSETVDWPKFVAISLAFLEQSLKGTMLRVCEVLTEEPEGGSAAIPCSLFLSLYRYLGELDYGEPIQNETLLQIEPNKTSLTDADENEGAADTTQVEDGSETNMEVVLEEKGAESKDKEEDELSPESPLKGEEVEEEGRIMIPGIGPRLPPEMIDRVEEYLLGCADRQDGFVMPRNLRHFLCPPLDIESSQPLA